MPTLNWISKRISRFSAAILKPVKLVAHQRSGAEVALELTDPSTHVGDLGTPNYPRDHLPWSQPSVAAERSGFARNAGS
jgi:hypothetical protein